MFEAHEYDDDGSLVDPRDALTAEPTRWGRAQTAEFASVLCAKVSCLSEADQVDLLAELAARSATLDWMKCDVATTLAIADSRRRAANAEAAEAAATERTRRGSATTIGDRRSARRREATRAGSDAGVRRFGGADTPEVDEFLPIEIALALSCSEAMAAVFLAVGLDLRFRLRCTNSEFAGGRITFGHARVISEATRDCCVEVADRLDEQLADAAATRTPARLRELARRLVARMDAAAVAARLRKAHTDRAVSVFGTSDGMGALCLNHDLTVLAAADEHIIGWARRRQAADPAGTLAAHAADVAAFLLLGRHPLTGEPLLATPRALPDSDDLRGAAGSTAEAEPSCSDRLGRDLPADPRWGLPVRTQLRVTMSADALLGLENGPAELDGYGPITVEQARRLVVASGGVTLRRVFTDPADDSVLFLDAHSYRFRSEQLACIRALHPSSTFPGSTTRADRCDIDHIRPYRHHDGGGGPPPAAQTLVRNAQPLSRRHHRAKTHGGWQVHRPEGDPHTFVWTSPRGRIYTVADHNGD